MHTDTLAQFIVDLIHDHVAKCDSNNFGEADTIPHIVLEGHPDGGADIDHAEANGSTVEIALQSGESYRIEVIRSHHRDSGIQP